MEAIANRYMAKKITAWFGDELVAFETGINTDPYTYI